MNWSAWDEVEQALLRYGIQPILAVVPDNRDEVLRVDRPRADFWERVREWDARGWTIAMHGYQHRYVNDHRGIVGINAASEFAGLDVNVQIDKLRRGLEIFDREGVRPTVWSAPAHSFDTQTLTALRSIGLTRISDGLTALPHRDRDGMFWIPQQLWRFRPMPPGAWTVCCHVNAWSPAMTVAFVEALGRYRDRIVDVGTIAERYGDRDHRAIDTACSSSLRTLVLAKRVARRIRSGRTTNAATPRPERPVTSRG
jgi:peptidoglycan/xylan/chitin deacetylase (PgdA/CDA1 family)